MRRYERIQRVHENAPTGVQDRPTLVVSSIEYDNVENTADRQKTDGHELSRTAN